MKKIILSVAVAAMALTTTASALEDIKVKGQAKLWYETWDKGTNSLFDNKSASGETVFTLGVTGKQGNVGFGATFIQSSTMGLENNLVSSTRTNNGTALYTSEMYITVPAGAKTTFKVGKQMLNTPLAFTEKWNATPNTFNAAVAINKSINNLTLVAAYVGQTNTAGSFKTTGEVDQAFFEGAQVLAAHYKNDKVAVNGYYYNVSSATTALWADASGKVGPVSVKGIVTQIMPKANKEDTTAAAVSVAGKAGQFKLMAAYSTVSKKGYFAAGNTATNFKKTKLPTAGVYTDGLYVAQPGSNAFKIKAATKMAGTGLALQFVNNTNDKLGTDSHNGFTAASRETSEIDLIVTKKIGDLNLKGIILNRSFDDAATDTAAGGNHVRVIASVNF